MIIIIIIIKGFIVNKHVVKGFIVNKHVVKDNTQ